MRHKDHDKTTIKRKPVRKWMVQIWNN